MLTTQFYQLMPHLQVFVLVPVTSSLLQCSLLFCGETIQEFVTRWVLSFTMREVIVVDGEIKLVYLLKQMVECFNEEAGTFF